MSKHNGREKKKIFHSFCFFIEKKTEDTMLTIHSPR